jgi:hypothetical protein
VRDQQLPFWCCGMMPDQYGRRRSDDDGMSEVPNGRRPCSRICHRPGVGTASGLVNAAHRGHAARCR